MGGHRTARTPVLSPDLALAVDASTQTFAFPARLGAGKAYGAAKLAEELLAAGGQVVASTRSGSGALLADLIVDKGLSAVLDVSQLRKHERKAFATDFADPL